eukprot:1157681-Pelagomonas_calceolata.AAC.7
MGSWEEPTLLQSLPRQSVLPYLKFTKTELSDPALMQCLPCQALIQKTKWVPGICSICLAKRTPCHYLEMHPSALLTDHRQPQPSSLPAYSL